MEHKLLPRSRLKDLELRIAFRPFSVTLHRRTPAEPAKEPTSIFFDTFQVAQARQAEFQHKRPLMNQQDTPHHSIDRIKEEAEEARLELPKPGQPITPQQREHLASEIGDIQSFLFILANIYGINVAVAYLTKIAEVERRYPEDMFQLDNGYTFDEAYDICRRRNGHSSYKPALN